MTDITPEKRVELRELLDSTGYDSSEPLRDWMMGHLAGRTHAATVDAAVNAFPALLDAAGERDRLALQVERVRELHDDRAWECANPQHTNPSVGCPECYECCMSCGEDCPCATIRALDADA